ncbi:fimbria/pilus outer membrane usher protein [Vibrio owensii]|uniref:fimbria/pilus outer membrane usher protein n=1 Tax=Vibrio owensii TaxID=696485 RepID=UPI0038CD54E6
MTMAFIFNLRKEKVISGVSASLSLFSFSVLSSDEFNFNTDFVYGKYDRGSLEKALYEGKNESIVYFVKVNGKYIGNFHFTREKERLKIKNDLIKELSTVISDRLLREIKTQMSLDLGAERYEVQENTASSELYIWFKDVDLKRSNRESTLPLSDSIDSLVASYSLSANYYDGQRYEEGEASFPFTSNIKLGVKDWGLNIDLSSSDLSQDGISFDNLYLTRLLENIKSEAVIGQAYSQSLYDEGFRFGGVQLSSVSSLFAYHEQNYTPAIKGYAKTNAVVEVYQDDRLLFTKAVAAGEFTIDEVKGASNQLMRVVVNEADGTSNTFFYENTVIRGLLTPGAYAYQVNLGRYRYSDNNYGDGFASFEYSYGFDKATQTASAIISDDYMSSTLGVAVPLQELGALNFSYSRALFNLDEEKLDGDSYSINYSKNVDDLFNVQIAGFRYSDENYLTFNDAMALKPGDREAYYNVKNRYTAMFSGQEPILGNNVSLNFMLDKYWGQQDDQETFVLSYGGNLHGVNYYLSTSRSYSSEYGKDTSISMNLDMPLGTSGTSAYARLVSDNVGSTNEVGINGYTADSSWSASVAGDKRISGSYYKRTEVANIQANFTKGEEYWNGSGSVSGTIVAADNQIIATNNQSTTFALAEIDDIKEARINGVSTRESGRALIPLNNEFSEEEIHVDLASLSNGVSIAKPNLTVRPKRDSVVKLSFDSSKVLYLRAVLLDANSQALKFGASVKTQGGQSLHVGTYGDVLLPFSISSNESFSQLTLSQPDFNCSWILDSENSKTKKSGSLIDFGVLKCEQ